MSPAEGRRLLTALVVDDEPPARRELRGMLEARPGIRLVGEAADVEEAARLAALERPDLVFLDIHLRGESGFALLDRLPEESRVVFVTAYEEHAVRAFEVNALDYLLKPVTDARLDAALERAAGQGGAEAGGRDGSFGVRHGGRGGPSGVRAGGPDGGGEDGTHDGAEGRLREEDHLFLRLDGSWRFVKVSDIRCIRAAGDYTRVLTRGGGSSLVSRTMKRWEERLPRSTFLRIHRSTIVNLEEVGRVEERPDGSCRLHLGGLPEPLRMSRRYAARIRDRLS